MARPVAVAACAARTPTCAGQELEGHDQGRRPGRPWAWRALCHHGHATRPGAERSKAARVHARARKASPRWRNEAWAHLGRFEHPGPDDRGGDGCVADVSLLPHRDGVRGAANCQARQPAGKTFAEPKACVHAALGDGKCGVRGDGCGGHRVPDGVSRRRHTGVRVLLAWAWAGALSWIRLTLITGTGIRLHHAGWEECA